MASHSAYLQSKDVLFLPWVESANDRRFKRILIIVLLVAGLFGAVVPYLPTPEIVKADLAKASPRITKLILQKKVIPLPPPPVPEKKPVKKDPVEKKPDQVPEKKKPVKKALVKKPLVSKAFEKASRSGLVALSDELAQLRDNFDLPSFDDKPLKKSGEIAPTNFNTNILTAKARQSSDGIDTSKLSRATGTGGLSKRSTTNITSSLNEKVAPVKRERTRSNQRDKREIEQVFQTNKGAIYSIYNRALRKDPTLQGKVIVELTISPQGSVTMCRIVSSELNDAALERKIASRIKLFKFKSANVPDTTVTYPIDFFPS